MIRFFTIVALALLLAYVAAAQEHKYCEHAGVIERFEYIRIAPPADVVYFDGKMLEYVAQDRAGLKRLTFEATPLTRLPEGFGKDYKRRTYALVFCEEHKFLYEVLDVPIKR